MLLMLEPLVTQGQVTVKPKPKNTLYVIMTRRAAVWQQASDAGARHSSLLTSSLLVHTIALCRGHHCFTQFPTPVEQCETRNWFYLLFFAIYGKGVAIYYMYFNRGHAFT